VWNVRLVVVVTTVLCCADAGAQDPRTAIELASRTMGVGGLEAIEYSGTGWMFPLGQAPAPGEAWPRFRVIKYAASINYTVPLMREELVRTESEDPPRGGGAGPYNAATGQGGIRPIPFGPQTQIQVRDDRTDVGLLFIWMTPHGFLKAAASSNATVETTTARGRKTRTVSFMARGTYRVTGVLNEQHLLERVETRIPNPMLGDLLVETMYSGYRDFDGVKSPTQIVQRQGGHPTLELTIDAVIPNSATARALSAPQRAGPALAPAASKPEPQEIAPGIWFLGATPPVSVLIEFNDHLVIVEAPGNDERTTAAIAEAKRLVPNKPIRYVVNTHHHFDHAGGLRAYAAAGVTIVTHQLNKPYYERIFKNPFGLSPDNLARSNRRAAIEGLTDKRVLTDGVRSLELYHVRGNLHDQALLMAYLPKEKLLIQADAIRPSGKPLPSPSPFTVNLYENVQRLKLDVARIIHVHGGIEPFDVLVKAVGR
jgi:glyoxylase-like metal-dependent hydrolase (beta-lactamase superfamily II)